MAHLYCSLYLCATFQQFIKLNIALANKIINKYIKYEDKKMNCIQRQNNRCESEEQTGENEGRRWKNRLFLFKKRSCDYYGYSG